MCACMARCSHACKCVHANTHAHYSRTTETTYLSWGIRLLVDDFGNPLSALTLINCAIAGLDETDIRQLTHRLYMLRWLQWNTQCDRRPTIQAAFKFQICTVLLIRILSSGSRRVI